MSNDSREKLVKTNIMSVRALGNAEDRFRRHVEVAVVLMPDEIVPDDVPAEAPAPASAASASAAVESVRGSTRSADSAARAMNSKPAIEATPQLYAASTAKSRKSRAAQLNPYADKRIRLGPNYQCTMLPRTDTSDANGEDGCCGEGC